MNRKIRYSLIALGFTVFIICAPLILLYVSGLSYNFQTRSFTRTGLIAVRIDPGSAAVYLNNKLAKKKRRGPPLPAARRI